MDDRFALVEFQGDQLLTIFDGAVIRIAMKHVCEALGIDWRSQHAKISGDAVLSKGVVLSTIPSERGPQQTLTLPIDLMHGWLFKLNPDKVAPQARERVIAYQRECYQVLHDYWVKGAAINPRAANAGPQSTADILKLVDRLKSEQQPEIKAMLYAMLEQAGARMALPLPSIEAFGQPSVRELEIAQTFFGGLAELQAAGVPFEHHRKPGLLAVSLREVEALFRKRRINTESGSRLWSALRAHPALVDRGPVNCRDGKARTCWIFDRALLPELSHPAA